MTAAINRHLPRVAVQKPTVAIVPSRVDCNPYIDRMTDILSGFAQIRDIDALPPARPHRKPLDLIIVNWLDNKLINKHGRLGLRGLVRFFTRYFRYRALADHVIFVRHNMHPHAASLEAAPQSQRLVDWLERLFSLSVVHSGHLAHDSRLYAPHPLYQAEARLPASVSEVEDCYVIFGRIMRYKKIESVIDHWCSSSPLHIIGPCKDEAYLQELRQRATGRNVCIRPSFVSEAEASHLVARARGMIIASDGADMIVSASYFYAISHGTPVFAVTSPFFSWIAAEEAQGLSVYDDARALCADLAAGTVKVASQQSILAYAQRRFGNAAVVTAWKSILRRSGLQV